MRYVVLFTGVSLLIACQDHGPDVHGLVPGIVLGHPDSAIWRAVPPLDTAALLGILGIADSASVIWTADSNSAIEWVERVDAIQVRNMMPACTCPDYAVVDSLHFGVAAVYIRPVSEYSKIPDRMDVAHNQFWLVGQRSEGMFIPAETMGMSLMGYLFRYGSYRVIRPYRIWGPRVFDASADTLAGEDPWVPSLLTVR